MRDEGEAWKLIAISTHKVGLAIATINRCKTLNAQTAVVYAH